jgi:hypothetical protein
VRIQAATCVVLFVGFLAAVQLQTVFHAVREPAVHGVVEKTGKPALGARSWLDGRLQQEVEHWYSTRVGFRAAWVRTDNQINFSLFREAEDAKVLVGQGNWLYAGDRECFLKGCVPLSEEYLRHVVCDLKSLQDALEQRHIAFLLVITPIKEVHYGEHLPDWVLHRHRPREFSNYSKLMPLVKRYGVHYVDGVERFREEKRRQSCPLFTPGGAHWTEYGASLVLEEIFKRLRELTGKNLANVECESVVVDENTTDWDNELGELINIWTPWVSVGPTPHLRLARRATGKEYLPNVLWVGTSFSLRLFEMADANRLYRRRDFLFYYGKRFSYPGEVSPPNATNEFERKTDLLSRDAVIVEAMEDLGDGIDYGFAGEALEFLRSRPPQTRDEGVRHEGQGTTDEG